MELDIVQIKTKITQMTVVSDYLDLLKCNAKFVGDNVVLPIGTLAFIILEAQKEKK